MRVLWALDKNCFRRGANKARIVRWEHLLNPILVTEALNRPQKGPNRVLNGKLSQPYSQYPVRAQASDGAVNPLYTEYWGWLNNYLLAAKYSGKPVVIWRPLSILELILEPKNKHFKDITKLPTWPPLPLLAQCALMLVWQGCLKVTFAARNLAVNIGIWYDWMTIWSCCATIWIVYTLPCRRQGCVGW